MTKSSNSEYKHHWFGFMGSCWQVWMLSSIDVSKYRSNQILASFQNRCKFSSRCLRFAWCLGVAYVKYIQQIGIEVDVETLRRLGQTDYIIVLFQFANNPGKLTQCPNILEDLMISTTENMEYYTKQFPMMSNILNN